MQQSNAQYFDLSHFSLLEISGKDAFSFLHGQLTCDLNDLAKYGWLFSAWCLPNGKVLCTFIIFVRNESFFLVLPSMLKEKILKRLAMFILRSEVTVTDVSENYALFGFSGNNVTKILHPIITANVITRGRLKESAAFSILELWDKSPRFMLLSKIESVTSLLNNITVTCIAGERSGWSLMDIEAGMPWIINATSESFLPQMLNIDQMYGLSYKKGCYPGQEIIARLHFRGQLKKRMYLGTGTASVSPGPGDRLVVKENGNFAGEVIDAERHASGEFSLLAIADTALAENDMLVLDGMNDISVNLHTITYPDLIHT